VNKRKAAERAAQKAAVGASRATHINEDTMLKRFNKLSSYKHKDDLITIAGTLRLPIEGHCCQSHGMHHVSS
jgi:hypothetical protein